MPCFIFFSSISDTSAASNPKKLGGRKHAQKHTSPSPAQGLSSADEDALAAYTTTVAVTPPRKRAVIEHTATKTEIQTAVNKLLDTVTLPTGFKPQTKTENTLQELLWKNIKSSKLNILI